MCKTDVLDKFQDAIAKANLKHCANSELGAIQFKDRSGNYIDYKVDKIYKIGKPLRFGVISRVDTGEVYLVDIDSIKKMALYGYVNNVVVTSGNALKPHKNKIAKCKNIVDYEKVTIGINEINLMDKLKEIEFKYGYIINVDDTNIDSIAWLRLEPYGVVFDLNARVCAVYVKDELGHKELLEIKKFMKMTKAEYSLGKWSPQSDSYNFFRALPYVEVAEKELPRLKEIIGDYVANFFKKHTNGPYYRCDIDKISIELARVLFSDINDGVVKNTEVYYAIPRPEKFESEKLFKSALNNAAHMEDTEFSKNRYELVSIEGFNRDAVQKVLSNRYSELHAGSYLKTNKSIVDYVNKVIEKEHEKAYNANKEKAISIINAYNNGEDVESMMKELDILVLNEDCEVLDSTHGSYVYNKLISKRANSEDIRKYMKTPTVEELAESFGLEYMLVKRVYEESTEQEDEINFDSMKEFFGVEEQADEMKFDTDNKYMRDFFGEEEQEDVDGIEFDMSRDAIDSMMQFFGEDNIEADIKSAINDIRTIVIDKVNISEKCRVEVRIEESSKVCTYIIVESDEIRIDESEQTHLDYIKNGVDTYKIEKVLKRTLALLGLADSYEDIIKSLL